MADNLRRYALALAITFSAGALADGQLIELNPANAPSATLVSGDGRTVLIDTSSGPFGLQYYLWTPTEGAILIPMPNQESSIVSGFNFDGTVFVGGTGETGLQAMRFVRGGTVELLGYLGTFGTSMPFSIANGVSGDGNVLVGSSSSTRFANEAFRWTRETGMVGLGTLNNGLSSQASAVSGDGNVVVGDSVDGALAGTVRRAFRWTRETGMVSLGLAPGLSSTTATTAVAANWDGSAIAGNVLNDLGGPLRAFRWTQAGGTALLELPAGWVTSRAAGITADGNVIVGTLAGSGTTQGFHWSTAAGTRTVEQWLQANGVNIGNHVTESATGVSYDGNTVIGDLLNGNVYIARIGAFAGLITLQDMNASLGTSVQAPAQLAAVGGTVINGAHSRPLARRAAPGKSCAWAAGDFGRDDHGERNGSFALGEIGGCHRFGEGVQAGLSVGASTSKQELPLGGRSDADTTFAVLEGLYNIPSTRLWASAALLYLTGDIEARRVYGVNGDDTATSTGRPDVEGSGIRLRLDWENAARFAGLSLTPYADVSYVRTRIDGYTETGGAFPARFDSRTEDATELHLGLDGSYALSSALQLFGRVEAAHRTEKSGAGTSGTVIGLFPFSFPGAPVDRDWLRLAIGADLRIGPGVASTVLNATTQGSAPSYWLNVSYQVPF